MSVIPSKKQSLILDSELKIRKKSKKLGSVTNNLSTNELLMKEDQIKIFDEIVAKNSNVLGSVKNIRESIVDKQYYKNALSRYEFKKKLTKYVENKKEIQKNEETKTKKFKLISQISSLLKTNSLLTDSLQNKKEKELEDLLDTKVVNKSISIKKDKLNKTSTNKKVEKEKVHLKFFNENRKFLKSLLIERNKEMNNNIISKRKNSQFSKIS